MKKLALTGCAVLVAGLSVAQDAPNQVAVKACAAASQSGDHDKVIGACKKAQELNKDWSGASYYMAKAYYSKKDYANSVAQYKTFLKLGKTDKAVTAAQKAGATRAIGFALVAQKKYADSIRYLTKTVAVQPDDHAAHYKLADAYRATKQGAKAEEHYIKVTQLNPKVTGAFFRAGMLAVGRKDNAAAKKYLTVFAAKAKGRAATQANYYLGEIAYAEGDKDAAKVYWEAFLASNPKEGAMKAAVVKYFADLQASSKAGS